MCSIAAVFPRWRKNVLFTVRFFRFGLPSSPALLLVVLLLLTVFDYNGEVTSLLRRKKFRLQKIQADASSDTTSTVRDRPPSNTIFL